MTEYPRPQGWAPMDSPGYGSTARRHATHAPIAIPHTLTETSAPRFTPSAYPAQTDMSVHGGHASMGERIIVGGRVLDEDGRPVRGAIMEIWQANAAGRYDHIRDQHDAPLDPHFAGTARVFADDDGRWQITTIRPGAYPWGNHPKAWRPMHIHFGLMGRGFAQRLVTQMYFPGDPLLPLDPVFNAVPDADARELLVAKFDLDYAVENWALGYRFDIVLRGRGATPMEHDHAH